MQVNKKLSEKIGDKVELATAHLVAPEANKGRVLQLLEEIRTLASQIKPESVTK